MRFVGLLIIAAALAAAGYHFSQQIGALSAGYFRPLNTQYGLPILLALGILVSRLGDKALLGALIAFGALMATAAVTPHGLRLPEAGALMPLTLFIVGFVGALIAPPGFAFAAVALVLGGVALGNYLAVSGAEQVQILIGLALSTGAAILAGWALAEAADRMKSGVAGRLAAGVAGVGLYLSLRYFNVL